MFMFCFSDHHLYDPNFLLYVSVRQLLRKQDALQLHFLVFPCDLVLTFYLWHLNDLHFIHDI